MFMLMGIVKKNGIMIVDFALQRVDAGETAEKAIHDASMDRFRPILMTTLAAVIGAVPIALGFGADGASRRPLGLVIVGGLDRLPVHHALRHAGDLPLSRRVPGKSIESDFVLPLGARPPPSQARFAAVNVMIRLGRAPRQSRAKPEPQYPR